MAPRNRRVARFSAPYEDQEAQARERGWPVRCVPGEHLHQIAGPDAVATALADLAAPVLS